MRYHTTSWYLSRAKQLMQEVEDAIEHNHNPRNAGAQIKSVTMDRKIQMAQAYAAIAKAMGS